MSLPFIVGIAASKGKMDIADFTEKALKDPELSRDGVQGYASTGPEPELDVQAA